MAFQIGDVARHDRIGHFQLLRRTGKTAQFDDFGEDAHRLQPIHDIVSLFTGELLHDPVIYC
jgi:predicted component of type VI protein secretion system